MAKNRRAEADRLPISQRIDQRMPNPKRRQMSPTEWAIKGELFLNCSCTVFCPCVVSLGAHPPTEGHCHAWMAIAIDEGHYEGEDLSGLNVGLLVDIPGRMGEGNWKVAAYVDERASGKAYNGILQIFSGAAGGTTGLFTMLVSEIIGAERAPVEIVREGNRRSIMIGRKIQGEIEMLAGADPEHPVMVSNSQILDGAGYHRGNGSQEPGARLWPDLGLCWQISGDLPHRLEGSQTVIDPRYVQTMARYNSWQNNQIMPVLEAMPHEDLTRDRGAFFSSLLATANHLLWGDTLWMSRFDPSVQPPAVPAEQHAELHPTGSSWAADRFRMDGKIRFWADGLRALDLKGDLSWYSGLQGRTMSTPVSTAIIHFFNHQTHHRGQIHAMLTAAGQKAPVTDLVFMPQDC